MSLVIRNASGFATHRVEVAANGVDLVIRNMSTGLVEQRVENSTLDSFSL